MGICFTELLLETWHFAQRFLHRGTMEYNTAFKDHLKTDKKVGVPIFR